MKVDIIKKFKWYIVGFMLVAIMLSVSLSFCSWDSLSLQAKMSASKSGSYLEYVIKLSEDKDSNTLISVGDIVEYGRFYQDADAISTGKTAPQRWIVVDYNSTTKVATLLTEQVVVYGNFWGAGDQYYQNYYQSTVRSWLNSGKGSLKGSGTTWKDSERYVDNVRSDNVGSEFSGTASNQVNRGFLDVAFTDDEKSILIPKNMTGMAGRGINNNPSTDDTYKTRDNRTYINDLVWLPSWQEIYGTKENPWSGMTLNDGTPNTKFSYFSDVAVYSGISPTRNWVSAKAISGASAYARNAASSSYYNNGGGSANGSAAATWWRLRSPSPSNDSYDALTVDIGGNGTIASTYHSYGGIRPAVCVQL